MVIFSYARDLASQAETRFNLRDAENGRAWEVSMTTRFSKWKTAAGLVLIVLAVLALVFWEAKGREAFLMSDVLVAKDTIQSGTALDIELFRTASVPPGTLVDGAIEPDESQSLVGKTAKAPILKNAQLSSLMMWERTKGRLPTRRILSSETIGFQCARAHSGEAIQWRFFQPTARSVSGDLRLRT